MKLLNLFKKKPTPKIIFTKLGESNFHHSEYYTIYSMYSNNYPINRSEAIEFMFTDKVRHFHNYKTLHCDINFSYEYSETMLKYTATFSSQLSECHIVEGRHDEIITSKKFDIYTQFTESKKDSIINRSFEIDITKFNNIKCIDELIKEDFKSYMYLNGKGIYDNVYTNVQNKIKANTIISNKESFDRSVKLRNGDELNDI